MGVGWLLEKDQMNDLGRLFIILAPVILWCSSDLDQSDHIAKLLPNDVVLIVGFEREFVNVFVPRIASVGWWLCAIEE